MEDSYRSSPMWMRKPAMRAGLGRAEAVIGRWYFGERGFEGAEQAVVNRAAVLDQRGISGNLDGDQPLVVSKNRERLPRRLLARWPARQTPAQPTPGHRQLRRKKLTGELLDCCWRACRRERLRTES